MGSINYLSFMHCPPTKQCTPILFLRYFLRNSQFGLNRPRYPIFRATWPQGWGKLAWTFLGWMWPSMPNYNNECQTSLHKMAALDLSYKTTEIVKSNLSWSALDKNDLLVSTYLVLAWVIFAKKTETGFEGTQEFRSVQTRTCFPFFPFFMNCTNNLAWFKLSLWPFVSTVRHGLVVRISGSHPGGPGSIPGVGILLFCGLFSVF